MSTRLKTPRAVYSREALLDCTSLIKNTNWTVKQKAEHFSKCFEVEKVFNKCREKTNCIVFETDYNVWNDYCKAVGSKRASKKELDIILRRCYHYLCYQINEINELIEKGEVDEID